VRKKPVAGADEFGAGRQDIDHAIQPFGGDLVTQSLCDASNHAAECDRHRN
jgi:hypothetical protein